VPPGINPPWILRFGADTVPVIQLALSSDSMTEAALYDYGLFRVRQQLSTVAGTLLPAPYRQIMVDLGQDALNADGLSPIDISNAINAQNVTLPSGTVKIGAREYSSRFEAGNSKSRSASKLRTLPSPSIRPGKPGRPPGVSGYYGSRRSRINSRSWK